MRDSTGTCRIKTLKLISLASILSSTGAQDKILTQGQQIQSLEDVFGSVPKCYGFGRKFSTSNTIAQFDKSAALAQLASMMQVSTEGQGRARVSKRVEKSQDNRVDALFDQGDKDRLEQKILDSLNLPISDTEKFTSFVKLRDDSASSVYISYAIPEIAVMLDSD